MAELTEDNVDEFIDKAIDKYWERGLLVDALFWSKAVAILRDKIRAGSSEGKSTGLKHQGSENR